MNRMRVVVGLMLLTIGWSATAFFHGPRVESHPTPPTPPTPQGEPFLPAYLDMLQGKRPFPKDNACYPGVTTLPQLLLPCDKPE